MDFLQLSTQVLTPATETSALKGCVVGAPVGCPITAFDLTLNRCERDYLHVNLILTKNGNVPTSCAIIDFPVALVQAGGGRSFAHRCHQIGHTMCSYGVENELWNASHATRDRSKLCSSWIHGLAPFCSTGSCSTTWSHWCCWRKHLLLKLHSEDLDSGLSVWKEASLFQKKKKKKCAV